MWLLACKILIFITLLSGFTGLFYLLRKSRILKRKLQEAYETIDMASSQRAKERKRELTLLQDRNGILNQMEQKLIYSGLPRRFPFLTTELWLITLLGSAIALYFIGSILANWMIGLLAAGIDIAALLFLVIMLCNRNYRAVDESLLSFCNLLGNYSITAGEVTGIFNQISKYLEDPLKSVLDECYYEAQTSGDSSLALLSMADKIEHPKFKEFVRNIEVCSRFSTDFTALVVSTRKEIQDYMRARQERRALANEALINMVMLLGMLLLSLMLVDQLIEIYIWNFLLQTTFGLVCLCVSGILLLLFFWEISTTDQ